MDNNLFLEFKKHNPWHDSPNGSRLIMEQASELVRRENLFQAIKKLNPSFVLNLEGPRRVGKSQLMRLMMAHLVSQENISPKQIIFINCEVGTTHTPHLIDQLKEYCEEIYSRSFEEIKEKLFFFMDEVTQIPDWEKKLKIEVDKKSLHQFVISSSSVIHLLKSKQSLVGRISTVKILPFSFYEAIQLYKKMEIIPSISDTLEKLTSIAEPLRGSFSEASSKGIQFVYEKFQLLDERLNNLKEDLLIFGRRYLIEGGYPDFIRLRRTQPDYFTESIIPGVVYKDIASLFNLKPSSAEKIYQLLYRLAYRNTKIVHLTDLKQEIGETHAPRMSQYLHYLQSSQLLELLAPYGENKILATKKGKRKIYFLDQGFVNQLTGILEKAFLELGLGINETWEKIKGPAAETSVFQHLKRIGPNWKTSYYRDEDETKDIDFMWETSLGVIPIECKMRRRPLDRETTDRILKVMERKKTSFALVTTESELSLRANKILCIPLYYFLGVQDVG
ncbi:MAG: ATP-binding protein [Deltaproteobacteria bacterium]|nr:ATP-binding protein [Deltaproteobacteria bacterium]